MSKDKLVKCLNGEDTLIDMIPTWNLKVRMLGHRMVTQDSREGPVFSAIMLPVVGYNRNSNVNICWLGSAGKDWGYNFIAIHRWMRLGEWSHWNDSPPLSLVSNSHPFTTLSIWKKGREHREGIEKSQCHREVRWEPANWGQEEKGHPFQINTRCLYNEDTQGHLFFNSSQILRYISSFIFWFPLL